MRAKSTWAFRIFASLLTAGVASAAQATNLLKNGDFELGTYTSTISGSTNTLVPVDWTPDYGFDYIQSYNHVAGPGGAESGLYYLSISNYDYQPLATLSQTFSDVSGAKYTVSFWAYDGGAFGDSNAYLDVSAGGQDVKLDDTHGAPFANYTFTFTGSGSDTLQIAAQTNPSEWYVDNVSVSGAVSGAVPEPATWAMMLLGFAGIGWAAHRRSAVKTTALPAAT